MKEILDLKKQMLDIQVKALDLKYVPEEIQDNIQEAFREAWYQLSLANSLIEESKIFSYI